MMDDGAQRARQAEAWAMLSGLLDAAQVIPRQQRAASGTLPLTVISGFLGAGKTTLLNRLLTEPHGRRLAILVNDFGRIDVDASLVRARSADAIALSNGCACCSTAGDLARTLVQFAQAADPPDAIVLEASGLADPFGIAQVALANPALRLEGMLTLVDVETLAERSVDPSCRDTFLAQLHAADLLLLTKTDLVDPPGLAAAKAALAHLVPGRPVLPASEAVSAIDIVLGLRGRARPAWPAATPGHAAPFQSWELDADTPLDRSRVVALIEAWPAMVLRAKGFLHLSDDPARRTLLQKVGRRWSMAPLDGWDAPPRSGLVVIGTTGALDPAQLLQDWAACRA